MEEARLGEHRDARPTDEPERSIHASLAGAEPVEERTVVIRGARLGTHPGPGDEVIEDCRDRRSVAAPSRRRARAAHPRFGIALLAPEGINDLFGGVSAS